MVRLVDRLDYSNFKNEVANRQGSTRAALYHDVWDVLYRLQAKEVKAKPVKGTGKAVVPKVPEAGSYGGILIDDEGRILLREPKGHFGGYHWTFAKGKPDGSESPADAALREVLEETGYRASIIGALDKAYEGDTGWTSFFVMKPAGLPQGPTPETASIKWVTLDEAKKLIALTKSNKGRARDLHIVGDIEKLLLK